jgi:fucose 4-O-acetylase-like acetyltransferase
MNVSATPIPSGTITKSRIEFIDLLKAFTIFCLLWFHSIGDLRTGNSLLTDPVFKFFLIFHMPLFFMISGFFFNSSFNLNFKDFFWKKLVVLLIPHITWSIIIGLSDWGIPYVGWKRPFVDKPFSVSSYVYTLFFPEATDFWFLKDLFLTESLVFVSCKIFKKRYAAFIISMLFVLLFNFFGVVGKMQRFFMPIFWTGILLKAYYPIFSKHLNMFLVGSGILFVVCFYLYDNSYMIYLMDFLPLINFQQSFVDGKIIFNFTNIDISGFRLLAGLAGSIFFFAVFQRFWKKNSITSFISPCGQLTLGIYGIQSIILQRIMKNILDFTNVNIWIYRFIITPSTAAFVFFVSVLIIRFIQRNRTLTFVLFGSSLMKRGGVCSEDKAVRATAARGAKPRAAEALATEARELVARATEARTTEARELAARAMEARVAEARALAARAAEAHAAEARATAVRAAEARELAARAAEARATEARAAEVRAVEARAAEELAAEALAAEARAAEALELAARAAEARATEALELAARALNEAETLELAG